MKNGSQASLNGLLLVNAQLNYSGDSYHLLLHCILKSRVSADTKQEVYSFYFVLT